MGLVSPSISLKATKHSLKATRKINMTKKLYLNIANLMAALLENNKTITYKRTKKKEQKSNPTSYIQRKV